MPNTANRGSTTVSSTNDEVRLLAELLGSAVVELVGVTAGVSDGEGGAEADGETVGVGVGVIGAAGHGFPDTEKTAVMG